jgi:hypothetical protein
MSSAREWTAWTAPSRNFWTTLSISSGIPSLNRRRNPMNPKILGYIAGAVIGILIFLWLIKNNGE